jgi:hypothetical protein
MLRRSNKLVMVRLPDGKAGKAQLSIVRPPFGASFPEGIPLEQKTKDLLRMFIVSAPLARLCYGGRRTMFL